MSEIVRNRRRRRRVESAASRHEFVQKYLHLRLLAIPGHLAAKLVTGG